MLRNEVFDLRVSPKLLHLPSEIDIIKDFRQEQILGILGPQTFRTQMLQGQIGGNLKKPASNLEGAGRGVLQGYQSNILNQVLGEIGISYHPGKVSQEFFPVQDIPLPDIVLVALPGHDFANLPSLVGPVNAESRRHSVGRVVGDGS
jgi:hypothetical protein